MKPRHDVPDWVTRGKTIRQLIEELKTFENQDREVRISLDYGETHRAISLVASEGEKYCVLLNAEDYHNSEWQEFMDKTQNDAAA